MRAGYVWLASFLIYPVVGAPLLKARSFRIFGFPTRVVLSAGVGMVLISWTMTLFALIGLRWGSLVVLVAATVAFTLQRFVRSGRQEEESLPSPSGRGVGGEGIDRAATLIAIALTALSILAALAATVAGRSAADLILFWGPKAQQFAAARTIDVDFLASPFLEYLHVYYPPLVTNVFAFGAMFAGRFPWGAATLTFPISLAAIAVGLAGVLRIRSGVASATATASLVTSAIALLGIYALVPGNADPLLLFFETLSISLLLTPAAASTVGKLVAGLLLSGAAASKVEGLPYVVAAAALFLVVERRSLDSFGKALLLLLGPAAIALGTWFAFGATRRLFYGYRSYGRLLNVRWDYFTDVFSGFGLAFWKAGYALPFLVPLLVVLLTGRRNRRALIPLGTAAALVIFLTFTYLHGEVDPTLWISWSAARVFSPVTSLLALAAWCSASR